MKFSTFFLTLTLLSGIPKTAPAANEMLTAAIFNFEANDDGIRDLGPKISALLTAQLSTNADLILVERAELDKIVGELELGLSGTVSADTAAKVGHLTGAKVLITGRVLRIEKELMLVAKIIGTETSRVYGELVKGTTGTPVSDLAAQLAGKISAVISQRADTLAAKVPSREDRVASIKQRLATTKRPAIRVSIVERHFGGPTIDPAAETEISLLLRECGFTLVDDKSRTKPAFEIVGEAFSELALRKGNLVACKARVEVKLRELATGKILAADRQTTVAVDLSEQIAGKNALAKAAAELAERLIPLVAK